MKSSRKHSLRILYPRDLPIHSPDHNLAFADCSAILYTHSDPIQSNLYLKTAFKFIGRLF